MYIPKVYLIPSTTETEQHNENQLGRNHSGITGCIDGDFYIGADVVSDRCLHESNYDQYCADCGENLVQLYHSYAGENIALRNKLKTAEAENAELQDQFDVAVGRVGRLEAEEARLRLEIKYAVEGMDEVNEINPSNYDHEGVCRMNTAYCYAYGILVSALSGEVEQ